MLLLATDNGPHTPESPAGWTAGQIIDTSAAWGSSDDLSYNDAIRLRDRVEKALIAHHREVQDRERQNLKERGSEHLAVAPEASADVADALETIMQVIVSRDEYGAPVFPPSIRTHFDNPAGRLALTNLLVRNFHEVAMIERSWHAQGDPDHPMAKAFLAVKSDGHLALARPDVGALGGHEVLALMHQHNTPPQVASAVEG